MLRKNESTLDRAVRGIAGAGLLVAAVAGLGLGSGGAPGVVFGAVGAILLATAVTGFCPLYRLFASRPAAAAERPDRDEGAGG